jgi:hypothetical protein
MAQIFWMTPEGVYVNETSAGGVQWMTPEGVYVNEQPAAAGGATAPNKIIGGGVGGRVIGG